MRQSCGIHIILYSGVYKWCINIQHNDTQRIGDTFILCNCSYYSAEFQSAECHSADCGKHFIPLLILVSVSGALAYSTTTLSVLEIPLYFVIVFTILLSVIVLIVVAPMYFHDNTQHHVTLC
jgi:hypothetical protein